MRIKAQITIELDVEDYIAAADHQTRIEGFYRQVRGDYGQAALSLHQMRPRMAVRPDDRRRAKRRSGALAVYGDD